MKRRILAMLLALAMFAGIGSVALAEETDEFAQYLTDMYDEVEIEYRPDVRWWLAEGLNTDATLEKNGSSFENAAGTEGLLLDVEGSVEAIVNYIENEWDYIEGSVDLPVEIDEPRGSEEERCV